MSTQIDFCRYLGEGSVRVGASQFPLTQAEEASAVLFREMTLGESGEKVFEISEPLFMPFLWLLGGLKTKRRSLEDCRRC